MVGGLCDVVSSIWGGPAGNLAGPWVAKSAVEVVVVALSAR